MNPQVRPDAIVTRPTRARPPLLSIVKSDPARSTQPTPDELAALVQCVALSADRQAFAVLFRHFAPRVKTYLMRAGADDDVAEEVAQETMVALWRKAAMFDQRQAAVSTWVFTIARNLRVDRFRRQGGTAAALADGMDFDTLQHAGPAPDETLHAGQLSVGVRQAMSRLPAEQAQVLYLSFFEEKPHARIAQELGIPLGTVKSRVRLAVTHLRRLLDAFE